MTKKQYFMFWWAVIFVVMVVQAIVMWKMSFVLAGELAEGRGLAGLMLGASWIVGFIFYGFLLSLGIDFAQKVGAKILLLDGHSSYHFIKDVLKPAVIVGIAYSVVVLIVKVVVPNSFLIASFVERVDLVIYQSLLALCGIIPDGVFLLLFCLCGLALLLKKIIKNISTTTIDHVSVVVIAVLRNIIPWMWKSGFVFMIDPLIGFATDTVLGVLFWKKGFETAVLCHFVIVFILYVITPAVVIFAGV